MSAQVLWPISTKLHSMEVLLGTANWQSIEYFAHYSASLWTWSHYRCLHSGSIFQNACRGDNCGRFGLNCTQWKYYCVLQTERVASPISICTLLGEACKHGHIMDTLYYGIYSINNATNADDESDRSVATCATCFAWMGLYMPRHLLSVVRTSLCNCGVNDCDCCAIFGCESTLFC